MTAPRMAMAPIAASMPIPAFDPVLRLGVEVPNGGLGGVDIELAVFVGRVMPILFASELAYSVGNLRRCSSRQATTKGSSSARPVDTVVTHVVWIVQLEAELTHDEVVQVYIVDTVLRPNGETVTRACTCTGVENVLKHTLGI